MGPPIEEPSQKPFLFSPHADRKIGLRELDRAVVEKVLSEPDEIVPARPDVSLAFAVMR
jgi:hypothetical protein